MSPAPPQERAAAGQPAARASWAPLPRSTNVLLAILGTVALGVGTRWAAEIIAPSMLALVLTIAVLPVAPWLRRHHCPGWLATIAALATAYAIVLVLIIGSAVCLIRFVDVLPKYADKAQELVTNIQDGLSKLGLSTSGTGEALHKLDLGNLASALEGAISGVFGAIGFLFFLVTLMFFFVVAAPGFTPRIAAVRRHKPELAASVDAFLRGTQRYLLMTALFGAIVGILDAGALWLIAVPLPLVWGFFSFITNFIPNIGFVIGIIPPALLALLDSGWHGLVLVVVAYSVLNVTIQTFIQPRVVGNSVGLSGEITFMSLVVWTFLLGALGALLAVPMTLLVRAVFIDADKRAQWVAPLIDTKVTDEPPAEDLAVEGPSPDGSAAVVGQGA